MLPPAVLVVLGLRSGRALAPVVVAEALDTAGAAASAGVVEAAACVASSAAVVFAVVVLVGEGVVGVVVEVEVDDDEVEVDVEVDVEVEVDEDEVDVVVSTAAVFLTNVHLLPLNVVIELNVLMTTRVQASGPCIAARSE